MPDVRKNCFELTSIEKKLSFALKNALCRNILAFCKCAFVKPSNGRKAEKTRDGREISHFLNT
jgi:hypothetical protein